MNVRHTHCQNNTATDQDKCFRWQTHIHPQKSIIAPQEVWIYMVCVWQYEYASLNMLLLVHYRECVEDTVKPVQCKALNESCEASMTLHFTTSLGRNQNHRFHVCTCDGCCLNQHVALLPSSSSSSSLPSSLQSWRRLGRTAPASACWGSVLCTLGSLPGESCFPKGSVPLHLAVIPVLSMEDPHPYHHLKRLWQLIFLTLQMH